MKTINESNNLEFLGLYSGICCAIFNITLLTKINKITREIRTIDSEKTCVYTIPEYLLSSELDKPKKHMIKKEYSIYMNTFIQEMKKKLPGINLSAFYENSKNFSFEQENNIFNKIFGPAASFYSDGTGKHKIIFISSKIRANIWHEFLHMASQRRYFDHLYSGFSQTEFISEKPFEKNIGIYLNEGYTELLNKRYFTEHGATIKSYLVEKHIAQILEHIVGKNQMEQLYFNSDLSSLCMILTEYDTAENILKFFKYVDIIGKYRYTLGCTTICKRYYNFILKILLKWYFKKIIYNRDNLDPINPMFVLSPDILELFTKSVGLIEFKGLSLKEISGYIHYLSQNEEFMMNNDKEKDL